MGKISVIGAGAWGTTIANILADNLHDVALWVRTEALAEIFKKRHENIKYLPGIKLNEKIKFSTSLKKCLSDRDTIFLAIPSQHIREIARKISPFAEKKSKIINLAKGIEKDTYKRMSEILAEELPNAKIATLSGPNHSFEIARKMPAATVIASDNKEILGYARDILSTNYFKVYPMEDIIGVEICSAVKNIPAIASGIIAELGYGDNAKAGIITLGLAEMNIIGRLYGAKRSTVYSLAGVGDLIVTCTSKYSRNQFVGRELAKGKSLKEITAGLHGMVAEGIETAMAVYEITQKHSLKMPLATEVYNILYNDKDINIAIKDLLRSI